VVRKNRPNEGRSIRIVQAIQRIHGSERHIRGPVGLQPYFTFGEGDILGLKGTIFGALADYKNVEGSSFTRLIVGYPSPAAAKEVLESLRANLDPYLKITATRPDGFDFIDFQNKRGVVERRSGILDIRFKMAADHSRPPLSKNIAIALIFNKASASR